jgi:hypothetical protein
MTSRTIQVLTTVPTAIERGFVPIIARTRAAKGKVIAPENRLRAICISEPDVSDLPSKWAMFASAQLGRIAVAQLQELWEQQGSALTETHAGLWTTDALLAYAAREAESKRLTADSIKEAMAVFILTINKPAQAKAMEILASMAAPVKRGNEKQLYSLHEKLAAFITEQEDDESMPEPNPLLSLVARKMFERAEELRIQRESFDIEADAF